MRRLFSLAVLIFSANSQTLPGPPPEFPPETGRPKDYHHCRINADTIYPWIVAVYDKSSNNIVGHGSLLTYITFISTCRQYNKQPADYLSRGQFVWNMTLPLDPCAQDRAIEQIIKHPKCLESPQIATFFDYALFKLKDPFAITGPTFPTMSFPSDALEMVMDVKFVNVEEDTSGCILPSFLDRSASIPVFDWDSFVQSIPFHSKCVPMLCEKDPPDAEFSKMCEKRFGERAKTTQLCMKYKNASRTFKMGDDGSYWIAGAPLVCNSTTYGLAAQPKVRKDFSIHYFVTLLRVWQWLIEQMLKYSVPTPPPVTIDASKIKPQSFTEPNRPPIFDDKGDNPGGLSKAAELVPRLDAIILPLILYFQCQTMN